MPKKNKKSGAKAAAAQQVAAPEIQRFEYQELETILEAGAPMPPAAELATASFITVRRAQGAPFNVDIATSCPAVKKLGLEASIHGEMGVFSKMNIGRIPGQPPGSTKIHPTHRIWGWRGDLYVP